MHKNNKETQEKL
uniref:Uncharacterized protein n=1 Tax=Rhizophora mucronata TaxID=61149 RepID=A0A2P2L1Q0_RHIMU